jgi:hypothetical protein
VGEAPEQMGDPGSQNGLPCPALRCWSLHPAITHQSAGQRGRCRS